jgi:hypothetical protein
MAVLMEEGSVNVTVHVLVSRPAQDTSPAGAKPAPALLTFVEHGNDDTALRSCYAVAKRYRSIGHIVDTKTVQVEAERPNPTSVATAIALHELGQTLTAPGEVQQRATEHQVRQVTEAGAVGYLAAVHDLHVDSADTTRRSVLLRLARRALCGDPFAALTLNELAVEMRLLADEVPVAGAAVVR